jgi:hypothetical protein
MTVLFYALDSENNIIEEEVRVAPVIHIVQFFTTVIASILVFMMHVSPVSSVMQTGRQVARHIALYEVSMPFDPGHIAVSLFLDDTSSLMDQDALISEGWFEQLLEKGFIRGAALTSGSRSFTVGQTYGVKAEHRQGYHVDDQGYLRWAYVNEHEGLYADVLVDSERLQDFLPALIRAPKSILLYDRESERTSLLFGEPKVLSAVVYGYIEQPGSGEFIAFTNGIVTGRSLKKSSDNLMVISQYHYWWDFVQVIALILIFIVAIFLLRYAVRYRQGGRKYGGKGVFSMAAKKEPDDVISEIDRNSHEIERKPAHADLRRDDGKPTPAKRSAEGTEPEKKARPVKEEAPKAPVIQEEGEHSGLEKDGIIIRKG